MAIDTLRSAAHLQRAIGDELFTALISSDNTEAVRNFARTLLKTDHPTEITVGGRTYEILSVFRPKEKSVMGHVLIDRAKDMNAHQGKQERLHLLKHQEEIPAILRNEVIFVFTDDWPPGRRDCFYCVYWLDRKWVDCYPHRDDQFDCGHRILRRKV